MFVVVTYSAHALITSDLLMQLEMFDNEKRVKFSLSINYSLYDPLFLEHYIHSM